MQPQTRYVLVDGRRIASQVVGQGPPDFVLSAGGFNHTDVQWEDPSVALFLRRLASFSRLIRFDVMGMGASDRWPLDTEGPTYAEQLTAVLDVAEAPVVALAAMLDAGPGAIQFAVEHPDRVSHLLLYNTTARVRRDEGYELGMNDQEWSHLMRLFNEEWGTASMAAANVPSRAGDDRFIGWYSKYLRSLGTPTDLVNRLTHVFKLDARALLERIRVPTLVMHRRDYSFIPLRHGEYLAERIPGAEYVELPGADGPMFWETPDLILRSFERFVRGSDPGAHAVRSVTALLFTDIAGSTKRLEQLGDRDWSALLDLHNEICSKWTTQYGGRVLGGTGDGILAAFPNPSDAIRAAASMRDELFAMNVGIRSGIHAGEVEWSNDQALGLAVHIAARVMAEAQPSEVLVSRTVRDLVAGSTIRLVDAGLHELKGVSGSWELFRFEL